MSMKKYSSKGFTLLELVVLIALAGVLTAIGIPSFKAMMVSNEVTGVTNDLMASLKRARGEAMSLGRDVIVCSSTDGLQCSGAAGNWSRGWLIYVDRDGNGQVNEANNELIWVKLLDTTSQLTVTPDAIFDTRVVFSFKGNLAAGVAGGFQICSGYAADGFPRRDINISVAGEATLTKVLTVQC